MSGQIIAYHCDADRNEIVRLGTALAAAERVIEAARRAEVALNHNSAGMCMAQSCPHCALTAALEVYQAQVSSLRGGAK